ncbi:MAG: EAL domain-containing protein [Pseudomonadota bacterium]
MSRWLSPKLLFVVFALAAASLLWTGAQFTLNWALKREALFIGMDWAQHIENRIENSQDVTLVDGKPDPKALPEAEALSSVMYGVFEIGHIYQLDYINPHCQCHVSLLSENPRSASGTHQHDYGSHGTPPTGPGFRFNASDIALIAGSSPNTPLTPDETATFKHPIDKDLVSFIHSHEAHDIYIRQSDNPRIPSTFAEVYYPVSDEDSTRYILRVLVNLEDQAQLYKGLIFFAALASVILVGSAIAYPTWRYITAAKKQKHADKRVAFLANHDVLTNLYNRNNFQETISDTIWTAQERGQSALLFMLDLDNFKEINDFYGHPVGDKILCEFASSLKNAAPENAYIARLGGDEFVVVISGLDGDDLRHTDFMHIPKEVSVNLTGGSQTVSATVSGGVVQYPRDAETTEALIQLADLALYAAKSNSSGNICEYVPALRDNFVDRLKIREEFRLALQCSQIEPYYQPIVNMKTGQVEGFEALARWNHPEKGLLTPFVFADALDDGELSAALGKEMFAKIVEEMVFWKDASVPFRKIALNVTDGDLRSPSFPKDILQGLSSRGLSPHNLTIEVTENCLFGPEKRQSITHLETLRDAGCSIALDDFGTGYSSITQLKTLPITSIKIDKSFIDAVLENTDDQSIISAMIDLGKSMQFSLVMEGIESVNQLAMLQFMGSELAQGYYYSRPMPAAEVPAFIERQNNSYEFTPIRSVAS